MLTRLPIIRPCANTSSPGGTIKTFVATRNLTGQPLTTSHSWLVIRQRRNSRSTSTERELFYHQLVDSPDNAFVGLAGIFEDTADQYALDQAQGFLEQAAELERREKLTPAGTVWLAYFRARLNLLKGTSDGDKGTLARLAESAPNEFLQVLARWNLGILCVDHNHWSEGVRHQRAALDGFQRLKESGFAVRSMITLGRAYCDLAEASGGITLRRYERTSTARTVLYVVLNLPFLVYERLVRRLRFLPNWYFGTNYQNWIVAYLLTEGAKWYRQAHDQLVKAGSTRPLFQIELVLADIDHRLNRWSRARNRYAALTQLLGTDQAQNSYRRAQVALGLGRTMLEEHKFVAAEAELRDALSRFLRYEDSRSVGLTAELLGQVHFAQKQVQQAVVACQQSLAAYLAVGDSLSATRDRLGARRCCTAAWSFRRYCCPRQAA